MSLRRLRLFLGVAAEGSISKAARAHGIAQPALTRQVQLLESEIGAQLFERSSRGLRLTEAGQFLRDALELPLGEIETALRSVRSHSTQLRASLSIGMPPSISDLFGSRLVLRLRAELPNVALRIVEDDSSKLAFDLSRRLIDTAVLVSVIPEQRVSRVQVLSEPLRLVGAAGAPAVRGTVPFRSLEGLPLLLPPAPSGLRITLDRAAESAGVKIVPVMEIESIALIRQIVRGGDAYTLLPPRAFRRGVAEGLLAGAEIVEPDLAQPVLWAVKPDWRLPRSLYNQLERIVVDEWYEAVTSGDWPAEWVLDFDILSLPFDRQPTPRSLQE